MIFCKNTRRPNGFCMTKLTCTRSSPRHRRQMLPIFHQKINRTAVGCNFVSLLRPFCFNIFLIGGFCGKSDLRNWRGKENRLAPRRRKRTVSWRRLVKCIIIELVLRANLPNFRENAKKNERGKRRRRLPDRRVVIWAWKHPRKKSREQIRDLMLRSSYHEFFSYSCGQLTLIFGRERERWRRRGS